MEGAKYRSMHGWDQQPFRCKLHLYAYLHLEVLNFEFGFGGNNPIHPAIYYPITHHQHGKAAAETREDAACLPRRYAGGRYG